MKRRTLAAATAALLMTSALGMSACSSELVAQSGSSSAQSAANLDHERISSVLETVGGVMATADASLNAADLGDQVTKGALEMRTAQYALANANSQALPPLDFEPTSLAITNSDSWPRAIFNISDTSSTTLPVLEVYVSGLCAFGLQAHELCAPARRHASDPAVRRYWISIRHRRLAGLHGYPRHRSRAVHHDAELRHPGYDAVRGRRLHQADAAAGERPKFVGEQRRIRDHGGQRDEYPVSGLVLQDGSALVAANVKYTLTYQRTVAGSTMNLAGNTAALSPSGTKVEGTATADCIATIIMRIPSQKAGGNVQIVGGERAITKVALDPSNSPG